ncbi:hypothetical protein CORC01_06216 [Colletotrichum orchidophilum]|uniref:Uncharacterized protein n=1 Tax=Colletotrichum orchidophilum TaxID=1209926 RepID=A0A1G4BAR2_9PEZI|nr:uncharacterized protein CORC01_06216 [Colletotrichum orchidophilum]OHE98425.1 hypothetical protein CORC01_06216 [Colletotrichum orchidophilum]
MRFENWDVLLFPSDGHVPLKEFKIDCSVIPDPESGPAFPSRSSGLPTVHGFVPSLHRNTPLSISIMSWTKPPVSDITRSASKAPELVAFAFRVYIDGELIAEDMWNQDRQTPLVIRQSLKPNKFGNQDAIRFPAFNEKYLQEHSWNPAAWLGRIQVIITEAFLRDSATFPLERIKNVVAFSFCHAPLETLEGAAIAWPNRHMWENVSLPYSMPLTGCTPDHGPAFQERPARILGDFSQHPASSTPASSTLRDFQARASPSTQDRATGSLRQNARGGSHGQAVHHTSPHTGDPPGAVSIVHPSLVHQNTSVSGDDPALLSWMSWGLSTVPSLAPSQLYPSESSTGDQFEQSETSSTSTCVPASTTTNYVPVVHRTESQFAPYSNSNTLSIDSATPHGNFPLSAQKYKIPIPAVEVKSRKHFQAQRNPVESLTSKLPKVEVRRELSVKEEMLARLNRQDLSEPVFKLIEPISRASRAPSLGSERQSAAEKSYRRSVSFDPDVKNIRFRRSQPPNKPIRSKCNFTPLDIEDVVSNTKYDRSNPIL